MDNLPIYIATIDESTDGIINISLVDEPAVEVDFITLSKQSDLLSFKSLNDEKHLLTGVIMSANKLIYRRQGDYEYYIKYEPETIRLMSEKLLADMAHENIDIDHKQELLDKGKVVLQEIWIKTPDKPGPFDNIEDGSLLATYHVYDEDIWNMCKSDRFNGFSLCGYFGIKEETTNFNKITKINKRKKMLNKIKEALKKILVECGEVKTDKGILYYDGEEISEGMLVTDEFEQTVEDGEYTLEDGTILKIFQSKIETITPAPEEVKNIDHEKEDGSDKDGSDSDAEEVLEETPETPEDGSDKDGSDSDAEEVLEETPEDGSDKDGSDSDAEEVLEETPETPEIDNLKSEIDALKAEIEILKETIKNIADAPGAAPVAEEFKITTKYTENKAAKIAAYLRS